MVPKSSLTLLSVYSDLWFSIFFSFEHAVDMMFETYDHKKRWENTFMYKLCSRHNKRQFLRSRNTKSGFFVSPVLIPENGQHCMWLAEIMAPTCTKELVNGRRIHMLSPAKSQENILDVAEKGIFDVFCALESANFLRWHWLHYWFWPHVERGRLNMLAPKK
jgi:hypothetical protein